MKKITLLAVMLLCCFLVKAQETHVLFEDDFESYDDFIIENIGDYTLIDGDGTETYGFGQPYNFPNQYASFAYIIFNPNAPALPIPTTPNDEDWTARSGDKSLVAFASVDVVNDDWVITPAITLGESGNTFSFFAKAASVLYDLEYFNVGISTQGTDPETFTMLATDELAGKVVWQEFSYDLDEYAGQEVYLAIQHIADDQFGFLLDDFLVTSGELSTNQHAFLGFNQYVADGQLHISANNEIQEVQLFNLLGQNVISRKIDMTSGQVELSNLSSGIYMAKVFIEGKQKTFKIVVK